MRSLGSWSNGQSEGEFNCLSEAGLGAEAENR